jgi:hypothetical protein
LEVKKMTLMKSLLLGSAAGIVAVASAQAADLPTRKGAPAVEYVKVCSITVNGKPIVGFTIPGSDTCLKLTGYITGQIEGGNLKTGESLVYAPGGAAAPGTQIKTGTLPRDEFGYTTRLNFGADVVSNTAYGPLLAHLEMQFENGSGFDTTGNAAYINLAYVTWAGITAGKAPSFFSFTGGGPGWANFFSPDMQGFNQPDVLAYTASFGGGFSATIAVQAPGTNGSSGPGTRINEVSGASQDGIAQGGDFVFNGERYPDIIGNLKVSQGWGSAQVSGVGHYVTVTGFSGAVLQKWGYGVDAGVSFNLPSFGAGDQFTITGAYTRNAILYSGINDGMWGETGQDVNGNGQGIAIADTYLNNDGVTFATPTAWSIAADMDHHFSPEFSLSPEIAYAAINWSGTNATSVVSNSTSWIGGVVAHWDPVKNLDFEFEVLYETSHVAQPNLYLGPAAFVNHSDGFATRFEVTRSW